MLRNREQEKIRLKSSLCETLYVLTAQPKTYQRLSTLFPFNTTYCSLEAAYQQLGYYSFNQYIRDNREDLCFLKLFACENVDKKDGKTTFTLYYQNNDINKNKFYRPDLVVPEEVPLIRAPVSFDETIYFELHNAPEFIESRQKFMRTIQFFQNSGFANRNRFVPLCLINQNFHMLYENQEFPRTVKEWFPNSGGIENIVQKYLFEDIDFSLSDAANKKECEFAVKQYPGCQPKSVSDLEKFKSAHAMFKERILHDLFLKNRIPPAGSKQIPSMKTPRDKTSQNAPDNPCKYRIPTTKSERTCFYESGEEDPRAENAPYRGDPSVQLPETPERTPVRQPNPPAQDRNMNTYHLADDNFDYDF